MRPLFLASVLLCAVECAAQIDSAKLGEALARKLCVTCHIFPEPNILDKRTWERGAFPMMANRLGLNRPENKALLEDWEAIKTYYLQAAPATALPQAAREVKTNLTLFAPQAPAHRPRSFNTSMVRIHDRKIYAGNAESMSMDILDEQGGLITTTDLKNPPVDIQFRNGGAYISMIGTLAPSENVVGRVSFFEPANNGWTRKFDISDRLHRPVHTAFADLNGDGKEDLVIGTFGYISGHLSWFENLGENKFAEHTLIDRPGALGSRILDVDGDGKLDIIVAMAQGREGVFVMLNRGNGAFQEFGFFQHHPSWGLASFEMLDIDKDGDLDILTANGDNGEFESCLKNYHGVRIYLNNGDFEFEEKYFFPLHGAFKAAAADFDLDGDLDMAAVSFFPDYEKAARESFVYLENTGSLKFKPSTFAGADAGRWITFDIGDLDADGDPDIVLAAMNKTAFKAPKELTDRWQTNGVPILILRNQVRRSP